MRKLLSSISFNFSTKRARVPWTLVLFALTGLLVMFAHINAVRAQSTVAPSTQQDVPLLQLGVGDEVRFEVFGQPDMNSSLYIADDGTVTIPLAGTVRISGLSPTEAAARLEKALKDGNYLVNPHVTITVMQTRSQRVSVLGEVKSPGRYAIDSSTTVFDLLAQAGGVNADAAATIFILRQGQSGAVTRYPINLRGLSNNKFDLPVETLQAGDSVYIPKADQFYIFGEVSKAGMYSIEPEMNVLQAIAKAGGISQRGSMSRIEIKRHVGEKKYKTFSVGLSEPVQPDDVIQIKESIF